MYKIKYWEIGRTMRNGNVWTRNPCSFPDKELLIIELRLFVSEIKLLKCREKRRKRWRTVHVPAEDSCEPQREAPAKTRMCNQTELAFRLVRMFWLLQHRDCNLP